MKHLVLFALVVAMALVGGSVALVGVGYGTVKVLGPALQSAVMAVRSAARGPDVGPTDIKKCTVRGADGKKKLKAKELKEWRSLGPQQARALESLNRRGHRRIQRQSDD